MTTISHPDSDREALSALFDGELVGDAARFALKRLDHDRDWRQSCERWSLVGDVLRAQGQALLPAGFPARVRAAAFAPAPATAARVRWARWGTAGLAASVAAAALFFARQAMDVESPSDAPPASRVATAPAMPAKNSTLPERQPEGQGAAQLASASLAVAEVSRQGVQRARSSQRPRGSAAQAPVRKTTRAALAPASGTAVAAASLPARQDVVAVPFGSDVAASRPWPRAVLPQLGEGALTTGFGTSPSFYPFEPRVPGGNDANDSNPQSPAAATSQP